MDASLKPSPWAVALAIVLTAASVRAAEPAVAPVIDIELDVADLSESRADLPNVVETELQRLLAERRPLPAGVIVADDRQVIVEVRPLPIPDTDDVLVHVDVRLDGERLAESVTEACLSCSDADVAYRALLLLEPLLAELPAPVEAAPAPAVVEAESDSMGDLAAAPTRPRSAWLISGGVLLGAGVVGIGVGIGLIAADERVVSPLDRPELEVIKYREPGIATLALGSAAAVTGAVLLGVALRARNRAGLAAVPVVGPRGGGVSVVGRF